MKAQKKIEIELSFGLDDLRQKPHSFWEELVEQAHAKILSQIDSEECTAYLLSESSLFVWKNRITLITCGRTTLVNAAKYFISQFQSNDIESVIFERKNEYFPDKQPTNFYQDVIELNKFIEGKAFRFGNADEHHLYVYHMNKPFTPEESDKTLEVLMYDLDKDVLNLFQKENLKSEELRLKSGIENLFEGFKIDDYVFEPFGYSLNGLKGSEYFTIHVTPQDLGCYVSFETNANIQKNYDEVLARVLEIFRPRSFDTIYFHPDQSLAVEVPNFSQRSFVEGSMGCGYHITYAHYFHKNLVELEPVELKEL